MRELSVVLCCAVIACLAGLGCGGGDEGAASVDPPGAQTFEAGPFEVPAGEELVTCSYVRGDNETEEDVVQFTTQQPVGGHHLIVYTLDHAVDLPPSACPQGGQPGWSQLLVTQIEREEQAFPEGVGYHVQPHQQYVLETHFINTTSAPITVESSFTATYGEPGSVQQRAATYFFGTMNIDVPPNAPAHASAACAPPEAMSLRTMFGHEHRLGTGVKVEVERAGGEREEVYQSHDWHAPPIQRFDEGLDVGEGDRIHVACDWQNTGSEATRFPHEMCFAIGYVWPAETGVICVTGGKTDACQCRRPGAIDPGPGGAAVELAVRRAAEIEGAGGPVDVGAPIYCAMFLAEDWSGLLPEEGAQPRYFREAIDQPMQTSDQPIAISFQDVTPGDYKITCMMDTIGGGWIPGTGDVVGLNAADVHLEPGQTATAEVTLDFAMP